MPATFALILLILAGISLIACYIPACKALLLDPPSALRHELTGGIAQATSTPVCSEAQPRARYSLRRATTGSTRAACPAGIKEASRAVVPKARTLRAMESGSMVDTW